MHGNVVEWVQDCWNDNYAGAPEDSSAWEFGSCDFRVLRGGSWISIARSLRCAGRSLNWPDNSSDDTGLRLAGG